MDRPIAKKTKKEMISDTGIVRATSTGERKSFMKKKITTMSSRMAIRMLSSRLRIE